MAPFDLDRFLASPRVNPPLVCSPDGSRLVVAASDLSPDQTKFISALWEIDPQGNRPPSRLTRSAAGEASPAFLPDGSIVFVSARPDPTAKPDEPGAKDPKGALWLLPSEGGEARLVASTPAGIEAVAVARNRGTIVLATAAFPGTTTGAEDGEREERRRKAAVTAQLFEHYPIRFWDHYYGPRERQLVVAAPPGPEGAVELRNVSAGAGRSLDEAAFAVTPDGSTIVAAWRPSDVPFQGFRVELVAIDVSTGERRTLAAETDVDFDDPACSPDGRWVAAIRSRHGDTTTTGGSTLVAIDLVTGDLRDLTAGRQLWPRDLTWTPDSAAVLFVADQAGRAPLFRAEVGTGDITRLAADGAYLSPTVAPDGTVYALRSTMAAPPEAVALDGLAADQSSRPLPTPGLPLDVPGRVLEIEATADDGTTVHSWLVLPVDASADVPAPLAVFIHGGPWSSWNAWSWRWNPFLFAQRGWAVLLPDPALSTGYGESFADRGRRHWGEQPYTDLMAAVDAAIARPDIDAERTAALGGSFGGYMSNWVAGHTDRFKAIVTHASLWDLEQFRGTTDMAVFWEREFGDPVSDRHFYEAQSPSRHVHRITTPMLVIHGELDQRVPISEALRLWTDLQRHGVESQFLYFPDENHWVLKPQNSRVWYETVFAFVEHHVLGQPWERPPLL